VTKLSAFARAAKKQSTTRRPKHQRATITPLQSPAA
jgi:hypothetical protein